MTRVQVFREKEEREREREVRSVCVHHLPTCCTVTCCFLSPHTSRRERKGKVLKKNFPHFRRMEN